MATKVKVQRQFTFKAYVTDAQNEVLVDQHTGEFITKSECHYYCEKDVLDYVKSNAEDVEKNNYIYLIYKVSTMEDSNMPDILVERITVKNGIVIIC